MFLNWDVFQHFYPTAVFMHRELRQGNFPLWNPYQYAGQPFVALHVAGALYPPNLLFWTLLSPAYALAGHFILHMSIAGIFTWLFAARLGLGIPARVTAALTYMLSGPLLLGMYMVPILSTQAWVPAILWALHGLLTEARVCWAVALAVGISLPFLGGHAQGFLYEVQFAFAYALWGLRFITRPGYRLRVVGLAAVAGLLALAFVAPQLLLAFELTERGVRGFSGIPLEVASGGRTAPGPLLWGTLGYLEMHRWARARAPARWLVTLPTATVPLALCGFLARRLRPHWAFFLPSAILVALFMLGDGGPVFPIYHALPLGDLFRNPLRVAFLYVFIAAMIVGIGLQSVTERLQALTKRRDIAAAIAAVVVTVTAAELYARTKVDYSHPVLGVPFFGGPALLIEYAGSQAGNQRVFVEQTSYLPKPTLVFKTGMMHGVSVVPDYEPNMPADYAWYFGIAKDVWHGRLSVLPRGRPLPPDVMGRLLDLMSVRYYVALKLPQGPLANALEAFVGSSRRPVGPVDILERPSALPRAYTVRSVITEPSLERAWRRMAHDSFDPRREAVIVPSENGGGTPLLDADPSREPAAGPAGAATITNLTTDEVVIKVECGARCLLVLTDLYYPGWRVYVDGDQGTIVRANAIFRGVYLEPGAHSVEYRYEPAAVRIGVWMLLGALAVSATLYCGERRGWIR
jgi:hypothetical protein